MTSISLLCCRGSAASTGSSCPSSCTLTHVVLLVSVAVTWIFIIAEMLLEPQLTFRSYSNLVGGIFMTCLAIGFLAFNILCISGKGKASNFVRHRNLLPTKAPAPQGVYCKFHSKASPKEPLPLSDSESTTPGPWSLVPLEMQVQILDYLSFHELEMSLCVSQGHNAVAQRSILSKAQDFGYIAQPESDNFSEAKSYLRDLLRQIKACYEKKYLSEFNSNCLRIEDLESSAHNLDRLTVNEIYSLYEKIAIHECTLGHHSLFRNGFQKYRQLTQYLLKLAQEGKIKGTLEPRLLTLSIKKIEGLALLFACTSGDVDVVALLLKIGLSPNTGAPGGELPLHAASRQWHHQVVELLLNAGADISVLDQDNKSALIHARLGIKGKKLGGSEQEKTIQVLKQAKRLKKSSNEAEN